LRWSDVYKLRWSEIEHNSNGKYSIVYSQKKTDELNYLPLSEQAVIYLGEHKSSNEKVFNLSDYSCLITKNLQLWCKDAGITKKITYHSSRHSFAVFKLSSGVPIFTVQKLLGHTSLAATLIYADIVDTEKERAMDIVPDIF